MGWKCVDGPTILPHFYISFRPRRGDGRRRKGNDDPFKNNESLLADYIDAEDEGKSSGGCFQKYGMCPFSIRSILTKVFWI